MTPLVDSSGTQTYSAFAPTLKPVVVPKTWSPVLNCLTSLPIASISPANSCPGIFFFFTPNILIGRTIKGWSLRSITSPLVTVAACTLISTSLSLGTGLSTSLISRTSGGPDFVQTIAFIMYVLLSSMPTLFALGTKFQVYMDSALENTIVGISK